MSAVAFPASSEIRISIVEDQNLFREALVELLGAQAGLTVVAAAADGEEAIRKILAHHPDVVLMDLVLPKLDGIEVTRQIKEKAPQTRIIAMTAGASDAQFSRALAAGVDGFVLKDARLTDLIAAIQLTHRGTQLYSGTLLRPYLHSRAERSHGLTGREVEILAQIGQGIPNRVIASRLRITEKTVRNHVSAIYAKLDLSSRTEAAMYAVRNGLA